MRHRTPRLAVAALLVVSLFVAGCARMPTSGPVQSGKGGNGEAANGQQPIQVFAQRPQKGWRPSQVVSGFLAAMASPERDRDVARAYLTPDIRSSWPTRNAPVVVYAQDDDFRLELGRDDTVTVTAAERATISARGDYRPAGETATTRAVFRLQRVGGQWRIGSLPGSVLLNETDAYSAYSAFDLLFFAKDSDTLVPNAIVLPSANQEDWPRELVEALIEGPTPAVAPAVRSAIPGGTTLRSTPTMDEDGTLTVDLGGAAGALGTGDTRRMVGQIAATLLRVEGVSRVRVEVDGRPTPAEYTSFAAYEPINAAKGVQGYFIRGGRLMRVDTSSAKVSKLRGPFGMGEVDFDQPAVSLDAKKAAGVSIDERSLSVGPLDTKGTATKLYSGTRLSAPSWDREGDLWVVDNTTHGPRLLMFEHGRGKAHRISAAGLSGLDVSSVRVAWDGVRVALVAGGGTGGQVLTGVLDRGGDDAALRALHPVAPSLTGVDDVWWYDRRSLAVAGRAQSDLRASYVVSVDGLSLRKASSVSELNSVASALGMPLLVSDIHGKIALSQPDEFSSTEVGDGDSPTYPG